MYTEIYMKNKNMYTKFYEKYMRKYPHLLIYILMSLYPPASGDREDRKGQAGRHTTHLN